MPAGVAMALQASTYRRCSGQLTYIASGAARPLGWQAQPGVVATEGAAQRWSTKECARVSDVLAPTSRAKPATGALLRRMTKSCASI